MRSCIGIEIDAREIRAVELRGSPDKPVLRSWGRAQLESNIMHEGMVLNPEKLGESIAELWRTSKLKSKKVILGTFNQGVIIRKADFPKVPDQKLDGLIYYQAQSYLPLPIDSVALDYVTIGEYENDEGKRNEVLLVAAQLEMVNGFLDAMKWANRKLYDMTVSPFALLNILPHNIIQGAAIIVDIANELGSVLGVINGTPRFVRNLKLRLWEVVESIPLAETSMIHLEEYQLNSLVQDLYNEIRYFINYFLAQERLNRIDKIILTGCGSRAEGIKGALEEAFEVQIEVYNPSARLSGLGKNNGKFEEQAVDFAVCIGLAIAGLRG